MKARGGLTWKAFLEQLRASCQFTGRVAATVVQRQERRTRTGGRIGIVTLSDPTAQFEATVYQERLADWRELLEPGQSLLLQLSGEYDPDTEELRTRIQAIEPLEADGGAEERRPSASSSTRRSRSSASRAASTRARGRSRSC